MTGFLWPEECKLVLQCLRNNRNTLAWDKLEKGKFREVYFEPVRISTIKHTPWALHNIPIPPSIADTVMAIIQEKIVVRGLQIIKFILLPTVVYSQEEGQELMHCQSLTNLNAVTIKDASLPPNVEYFAEKFGARSVYILMDLFVGYDLMMFQTSMGAMWLTLLPMGWTNLVQVFQGNVVFILQDEYCTCTNFVDGVPVMGPATRYETEESNFETMPENPGIQHFIWEPMVDVNHAMHQIRHTGGTFMGYHSDSKQKGSKKSMGRRRRIGWTRC